MTLTGRAEHLIPLTRTQLAAKIVDLNEDKSNLERHLGMIWRVLKAKVLDVSICSACAGERKLTKSAPERLRWPP